VLALLALVSLVLLLALPWAPERADSPIAPADSGDLPPTLPPAAASSGLEITGDVLDAARMPIAGARVECAETSGGNPWECHPRIDEELEGAVVAFTGPDGSFSFPLGAGRACDLRASHPGFAATRVAGRVAGERVEIELRRSATVVIRAVDPRGEAAGGTIIRLSYAIDGVDRSGSWVAETGVDGIARFEDLPPGRASLALEHVRFASPRPREVEILAGREVFREVPLLAGRVVEGTVRDRESGAPIAGAALRTDLDERPRAITDELGRFRCEGVPLRSDRSLFETFLYVDSPGHSPSELPIDGSGEAPLEFRLGPEGWADGIVVDGAGAPVPGVRVEVWWSQGSAFVPSRTGSAVTAEDGSFRIASIDPDRPLRFSLLPPGSEHRKIRYEGWRESAGRHFDLGTIVLPSGFTVSGVLIGPEGTAFAGAALEIWGPHSSSSAGPATGSDPLQSLFEFSNEISDRCWSDHLGRFGFHGIPPGEHRISAQIQGRREVSELVQVGNGDVEIRLLAPSAPARVVEVRSEEGEPLAGARVSIGGTYDTLGPVTTDRAGIARFAGRTIGEAEIFVEPPPGFAEPEPVPLADLPSQGSVVLAPAARVAGRVIAPPGVILDRLNLTAVARRPGDARGRTSLLRTNEDGSFELTVPVGSLVDLECRGDAGGDPIDDRDRPRWEPYAGKLEAISAPAESLEFRLSRLALDRALSVRVAMPDGAPIAGADVWVTMREHGAAIARTQTDPGGIARFSALPAMEVRVTCWAPPGLDTESVKWVDPDPVTLIPAGQAIERTLRRSFPLRIIIVEPDDRRHCLSHLTWRTSTGRVGEDGTLDGNVVIALIEGETADLRVEGIREGELRVAELLGIPAGTPRARLVLRPR